MATDITTHRLRELAETRSTQGKVLSVFINLDPSVFAAPPARATEISSVIDAASRAVRRDRRGGPRPGARGRGGGRLAEGGQWGLGVEMRAAPRRGANPPARE